MFVCSSILRLNSRRHIRSAAIRPEGTQFGERGLLETVGVHDPNVCGWVGGVVSIQVAPRCIENLAPAWQPVRIDAVRAVSRQLSQGNQEQSIRIRQPDIKRSIAVDGIAAIERTRGLEYDLAAIGRPLRRKAARS